MKSFQTFLIISVTLFTISCEKNSGLDADFASLQIEERSVEYPELDAGFSRGMAINNAGMMAGSTRNASGTVVAFRLSQNDLWLSDEEVKPNGLPEIRFAINDRGDVAAHKSVPGGITPVVWRDGECIELSVYPGFAYGEVFDINASGVMVGESYNGNFPTTTSSRATIFSEDEDPVSLGTLGGVKSFASSINDHGMITGAAENAAGQFRAFVYQDGVMTDLGTLGGTSSNATSINNRGEIVGRSFLANGAIRGFLYSDGVMTEIPTLGGVSSVAFDINDKSEVVGFSRIASGEVHAFLYKDGVTQDLNIGGIDARAISINNRGDIIGHYTLADGSVHAFLWRDGEVISL